MTNKEAIKTLNEVLDLITRQQTEIERLEGELNHLKGSITLVGCIKQSEE